MLGWPVAHSLSPTIQNAALGAVGLGESWRYQLLPVPPEVFAETVQALPPLGFRGVNVTIPHKRAALALAGHASDRARATGAANTLLFEQGGRVWADNTDAPALIQALEQRIDVAGASALVLGAGGSARAAAWALLDAGAREVWIWNRNPQRARELAAELGARSALRIADAGEPEILVHCTPQGLRDGQQLEALSLSAEQPARHRVIVDFVYRDGGTELIAAAREMGIPAVDGLELLIGQGALAFALFTGKTAPIDAMRRALGLSCAS